MAKLVTVVLTFVPPHLRATPQSSPPCKCWVRMGNPIRESRRDASLLLEWIYVSVSRKRAPSRAASSSASPSSKSRLIGDVCLSPNANKQRHELCEVIRKWNVKDKFQTLTYSTVGMRPDCDMLLWRICYTPDELQLMNTEMFGHRHGWLP